MPDGKILLDFEVEAHASLREGVSSITSSDPESEVEVTVSNLSVEPGTECPLLSVQVIITGDDLRAAEKTGVEALRRYLHHLTLVTNFTFRIHRLVRILDWTRGLRERQCIEFAGFSGHGLPAEVLGEEHFRSAQILQKASTSPALQRALKWFSAGVAARYSDDQFQFFWLVVELVSQLSKEPEKVNDRCPHCQSNLYCETCETYPTHRPYPKQAIEQLFINSLPEDGQAFFRFASDVRNAIMHGKDVEGVVRVAGEDLGETVDKLGRLAWAAILNELIPRVPEKQRSEELELLEINMYSHQSLRVGAHLLVHSKDPDHPTLDELGRTEISITYRDAKGEDSEPPKTGR